MKTIILKILPSLNRNLGNLVNHASAPRGSLLIPLLTVCFALLPRAQAVSPAPDGCYPNYTTAEGCNALQNLVGGAGNTGVGWYTLFSDVEGSFNTGVGGGALALTTGDSNTAVGAAALLLTTTGGLNTAVGTDALVFNDSGERNTATGAFALFNNTTGVGNTAMGHEALQTNTDGNSNTAVGRVALTNHQTGSFNTSIGNQSLENNTSGEGNVAVGSIALSNVTAGDNNVGVGRQAFQNATGNENIGVGHAAGVNETTVNNVICIGNPGDTNGGEATSNRCYIGNIVGVSTGGPAPSVPVIIDQDGQLGTVASSRRFKKDIKPMEQTSEAILKLKPVTFHYKNRDKKSDLTPEFGLIAEDVEKVDRDLVVYGKDGKLWSVRYDAVNAMLLNEFLKEHKKVEEQQENITQLNTKMAKQAAIIAQQQKGMEVLAAQLKEQGAQIQKVSAQLEMRKPAAQVVVNKP